MTELPDYAELPRYRDLPPAPRGGRSAWGMFGPDDNLGLINLLTPRARRGRGQPGPVRPDVPAGRAARQHPARAGQSRGTPRHTVLHEPGPPRSMTCTTTSTRRPRVSGTRSATSGTRPTSSTTARPRPTCWRAPRNTIDHWARHGIAGRAVVLDVARAMAEAGRHYHPGESTAIGVEELELARARPAWTCAGRHHPAAHGFRRLVRRAARRKSNRLHGRVIAPGLAHTEAVCEYLWDSHAAAIGSDTFAR